MILIKTTADFPSGKTRGSAPEDHISLYNPDYFLDPDYLLDPDYFLNPGESAPAIKENAISGMGLLYIVPTRRYARELKKELLQHTAPAMSSQIDTETIRTFALKLVSLRRNVRLPGSAAETLILKQSVSEAELRYFSQYKKGLPPGIIRRIEALIKDFKENGLGPEEVLRHSGSLMGQEALRVLDIASIYKIYQDKFLRAGFMEAGDIYAEVNSLKPEEFSLLFKRVYGTKGCVIIKGFDYLTEPEAAIIGSLSGIESQRLYIHFDYVESNPRIFSHIEPAVNKLKEKGFKEVKLSKKPSAEPSDKDREIILRFRKDVSEKLFNQSGGNKITGYSSLLNKIIAEDREKEILFIAREIRRLMAEENARPEAICLAFNLIERYSPLVRDIFENAGIPLNISDRRFLKDSLPVASIMSLLEIAESNYGALSLERFMKSGCLRVLPGGFSDFTGISRRLNEPQSYREWLLSIKNAGKEPEDNNSGDGDYRKKAKEGIRQAARVIKQLRRLLRPFEKKMTPGEFRERLSALLIAVNLPEMLSDWNEEEIRGVNTFIESVNEVFSLEAANRAGEEKHPLRHYLDRIRSFLTTVRYSELEKPGCGVLVTTVGELRGLKFDYLFCGGLSDGDFPSGFNSPLFFKGSDPIDREKHLLKERYHFYQVLVSWNKALYLSSPLNDKKRELTVSRFLEEFSGLFEMRDITASRSPSFIVNRRELLEETGRRARHQNSGLLPETELLNFLTEDNYLTRKDVRRALNITARRELASQGKADCYSGVLLNNDPASNDPARVAEALRKMGSDNYSVTRLETYTRCPFRYFLKNILKLEVPGSQSDEAEAYETGMLLHSILYGFYQEITSRGMTLHQADDQTFLEARDILSSIAGREAALQDKIRPLSFYEKEKIFGIRGIMENSLLFRFLEAERNGSPDFTPALFETAFEELNPGGKALSSFRLKGTIDRIDINHKDKTFRVIDYKLAGRKPSEKELFKGLALQLPVYMFAAARLLKEKYKTEFRPEGGYIYSLKALGRDKPPLLPVFKQSPQAEKEESISMNEMLISIALSSVKESVKLITEGRFEISAIRERKACSGCDFKSICRIREKF